ncbi:hypothetical protein EDC02_2277 [Micromonospora sp. Llam0]|uniref:hypothetical protein n=1 Tax=Micromonospora sp. Llam0 TaxID=2485143 RepID=UPI000FA1470B|nr:hypothetical protein [Micromonospora sp. Llam0]ROO60411.1 hypothetical protein EDC02_2277 [Micromonospora sp. Llam0]
MIALAAVIIPLTFAVLHAGDSLTWAYARFRVSWLLTTGLLIRAAVVVLGHLGGPE